MITREYQKLDALGIAVEMRTGDEGEDPACVGDFGQELLAMTAVHPVRESALQALAEKSHGDMRAVTDLPESGQLRRVRHQGETFCIRRLCTT